MIILKEENFRKILDYANRKAYKDRKAGITSENNEFRYQFKMSEFTKMKDHFDDIVLFCFMRRNYKIEFKEEEFKEYVRSFDQHFWNNIYRSGTPEGNEFAVFRELFHSGQVEVVE